MTRELWDVLGIELAGAGGVGLRGGESGAVSRRTNAAPVVSKRRRLDFESPFEYGE